MIRTTRAALALAATWAACGVHAAPPSLEALLKPTETDLVRMAPDGRHMAGIVRVDGRMMLAILDRTTRKPTRVFDPEARGAVESVQWVSGERVFVMNSRVGNRVQEAFVEPYVMSVNIDGSRKRAFYETVTDTLVDDPDVLVSRCGRVRVDGCTVYVQKASIEGRLLGARLAEAPAVNASLMADNAGRVLVATAWDNDDIQRLWRRVDGQWALVNDEAASGVEAAPFAVSRDGAAVFLRTEQRDGPDVIERMEVATGARRVVASDPVQDPVFIAYSADGREPIGAGYGLGVPRTRFFDDAHPDARLLRALEKAFPDDAVQFGSGSDDGQHVVVNVWGDRDPGSFYLRDRATRRTDLIARQRPWLDPDALARAHPVTVRARDGLDLHGYLTLPTDTGKRPPLVVMPHGGPYWVTDGWAYDDDAQVLASRGYAVLRVNFRGSGGRGRAFVERGHRQWGRAMQHDLADALAWAANDPRVDASRACILGGSYGGYAALMAAALQPDAYRCVVAMAAVTDLNLHWRRGDIRQSRSGRNFLERVLGTDAKDLRARSPVGNVAGIKAAVMLVHGEHDVRVPFAHARALREAFDKAGKPYEGWFPKDETHGIYGDENRVEYYTRVLAFLGRHLGDR